MVESEGVGYQTFQIGGDFCIKVEDPPIFTLSDVEAAMIERIWEGEAAVKGGRLFNGLMLCYKRHDHNTLYGYFIEYKRYIAILRQPALREKMPIETIGVSGLTRANGFLLWGKRASFVTEYPGFFECAPSGGINPEMVVNGEIPVPLPFEMELYEETGIPKTGIKGIAPVALVWDMKAHLYELVATIDVDPAVLEKKLTPSDEYDELHWVDISETQRFLSQHPGCILPMSRFLSSRFLKF